MEILVNRIVIDFYFLCLKKSFTYLSGELFAQAPVEQYPGIAVETVTDSSRYFVIRIQDGTGKESGILNDMRLGRWVIHFNESVSQLHLSYLSLLIFSSPFSTVNYSC